MAKVIVRSDHDQAVLMDETVLPAHLDDEHSAVQLLERLAWAIHDEDGLRRSRRGDLRRQADVARREGQRSRAAA